MNPANQGFQISGPLAGVGLALVNGVPRHHRGSGKDFCAGYDLEGGYVGTPDEPDHDPADYRSRATFDLMREHGLKEALRQRDAPYGEGQISLDDDKP